jgi:hypothetical protein
MLQTSMYFLAANDLYLRQKPYSLRFEPKQPFLQSNIRTEKHEDIVIEDIRGRENDFDFNANGFAVMPFTSQMAYDDFDDKQKLIELYLKEVADKLRNFLGALHVQIFEHTVRPFMTPTLIFDKTRSGRDTIHSQFRPASLTNIISRLR